MKRFVFVAVAGLAAGLVSPFLALVISNTLHIGTGEFPLVWLWPTSVCMMLEPNEKHSAFQIISIAVGINMAIYVVGFLLVDGIWRLTRGIFLRARHRQKPSRAS